MQDFCILMVNYREESRRKELLKLIFEGEIIRQGVIINA